MAPLHWPSRNSQALFYSSWPYLRGNAIMLRKREGYDSYTWTLNVLFPEVLNISVTRDTWASQARQPIMSCGPGIGPGLWRTLALSVGIKIWRSFLRKILKKANISLRAAVRFIGSQQCTSKRHSVNQNYVFTVRIKLLR